MSWNQGNYIIKSEEVKVKGKVRRKVVTKHVWYYSFRSKKLNEGLEFWKSGMLRKWYELIKNINKPKD
jgi:hypothetical protein